MPMKLCFARISGRAAGPIRSRNPSCASCMRLCKKFCALAIAAGGSSISDYVDADGEAGYFQIQHRAYGREGKPCLTCKTPIKKIVVGGRGTHYCPNCQK